MLGSTGECVDLYLAAERPMEKYTQALPPHSPLHSPQNNSEALSRSPSLPQPAAVLSASLPSSPTTPYSYLHFTSTPRASGGSHCLSPSTVSDQDDLTCLSWLHQRGNLLPLQPLPKITTLPQTLDPIPVQQLPSSGAKPPYSFSSLIFMAIEDSAEKRLPVKGIYEWIVDNFPYYKEAPGGWRNSVRHNLSLSKSFQRIHRDKSQSVGKGSLWRVCPEYRPALLEVLRKTHYCHRTNSNLLNKPVLLEAADNGQNTLGETMEISDLDSLSSNPPCSLTPDHEELVPMESVDLTEVVGEDSEKDPLADSGYIELHYYQYQQYQYLVLPGDTELDLETVEILQLDAEAQEAAGSLLDLAGGNL
ncbi:forkhead box protein N2-like isoform X2 [Sinocyclocheilus rhinocerous]|uniref:forkhead box protein N2-like isoform X2 n=1 Tax=Sinocyclocheilus rhinocerous TaxID=307959 RepID=UPI0007B7C4C8|nr:PREDICTED: forkhead box protein N2-like isoform X2 [Sinocyclocheilus rhinocerous]